MANTNHRRKMLVTGVTVSCVLLVGSVALFLWGQGLGSWRETVELTTDFSTITGLRRGSPVQLSGVRIGRVKAIEFDPEARYPCDPTTEDLGRQGQGRTDECDPLLFCAPEGLCAKLEHWASRDVHAPCTKHDDCGQGSVCVTKPFRRRYSRVFWAGFDNVCAHYTTTHQRVQIRMEVYADKLELVGIDSRASVASNRMLGDQLVSITRGHGPPIDAGGRIHSTPSIYEDIEMFRDRIEVMGGKVDDALSAMSDVFGDLNDERVISQIKDQLTSFNQVTKQLAEGDGRIGGFFGERHEDSWVASIRTVDETASEVDRFLTVANGKIEEIDRDLQPKIDRGREKMAEMRWDMSELIDPRGGHPENRLLYDPSGEQVVELEKKLVQARDWVVDVQQGKGFVGRLVNENDLFDTLLKLFGYTQRGDTLRALNREALKIHEERTSRP